MGGATTPGLCVPVEFRSHYLQKRAVLFKKERKHCALRAIQPRQHCALNQVGTLIASARDRDRAIALRVNIYTFRVNSAPRASSFRAANIHHEWSAVACRSGRPPLRPPLLLSSQPPPIPPRAAISVTIGSSRFKRDART